LHTSQRGIGFVKPASRGARDEEPLLENPSSINSDPKEMKPFPKPEQGRGGGESGLGSYSVRKDTRKLETRIETQLTELERWMAGGQRVLDMQARSYTDQQWDDLLNSGDALLSEIETLLDQLANMNSIQSVLMTNADSSGFYEQEEVRQRESRQKFLQHSFTKLRHSATELKQKATLCKKATMLKGGPTSKLKEEATSLERLVSEHSTLQNATQALDGLVQQALETRIVLQEQTVYLQETNDKVEKLAGILPRVNHIMMSIKGRKWRDLVIMGGFISICICALLLYWLSYRN